MGCIDKSLRKVCAWDTGMGSRNVVTFYLWFQDARGGTEGEKR